MLITKFNKISQSRNVCKLVGGVSEWVYPRHKTNTKDSCKKKDFINKRYYNTTNTIQYNTMKLLKSASMHKDVNMEY